MLWTNTRSIISAALRPVASPAKDRAEVPFDHAEDRLNVPTLPICLFVAFLGHQSSVLAGAGHAWAG